jgi:hypothetical protein
MLLAKPRKYRICNNRKIPMTLQQKQSLCKAMFGAMSEIMLDLYSNTYMLKDHDKSFYLKLKNLKAHWERETAKTYSYIEVHGEDAHVQQYHLLTNVFELLIESAGKGEVKFSKMIMIMKEYLEGNIKIEDGGQI